MPRTPSTGEDRREQILAAALRVFAQKGFARATNKDIAQEAGITSGLIYHYFKSKDDLLRAAIAEHTPLQLVHAFPAEMLAQPPETFLRFITERLLNIIEGERFVQLMRVFLPEAIHHPQITSFNLPAMQEVLEFLATYLQSKIDSGELRPHDPYLAAQVYGGSLMAFAIRRHILHDPSALQYTHAQIVDSVVGIILHGLMVN